MKHFVKVLVVFFCLQVTQAQRLDQNAVLFSIDDTSFTNGDFLDNYNKNKDIVVDESQNDIDHYLNLYINYNLKLKAAREIGLDTSQAFKSEYDRYYKQLADNFIANGDVTEEVLKETYNRKIIEVKARHLLIAPKTQAPEDTLTAYNKALRLKAKIEAGEDFAQLAAEHSDDPSAKINGGDLGWFNAFKMVYAFETAAYQLEVNEISEPVKSQFGYHIIQKLDERPSRGKIQVAHIMVTPKKDSSFIPEKRIKELYKLTKTEDFSDLAKQYSADKNTAENGGELPYFAVGGLNDKDFENTAFSLSEIGDISKPVKTRFGWHIIKLINVKPLDSYEEQKEDLRRQVKTSSRAKLINKKITQQLTERYNPKFTKNHVMSISNEIDGLIKESKFRLDSVSSTSLKKRVILEIGSVNYTYQDYFKFLELNQRNYIKEASTIDVIKASKKDFLYDKLIKFHRSNLVNINPEFAKSVKTFEEGILLFEVMQQQIWNPVNKDSTAQLNYYQKHKAKYVSKRAIKAKLFSHPDQSILKEVRQDYLNFKAQTQDTIFSPKTAKLIVETDIYKKGGSKVPNVIFKSTGVTKIKSHNNMFLFAEVLEVLPARQLEIDEVRGKIISELQTQQEQKWLKELRQESSIQINKQQLKQLKQSIGES